MLMTSVYWEKIQKGDKEGISLELYYKLTCFSKENVKIVFHFL